MLHVTHTVVAKVRVKLLPYELLLCIKCELPSWFLCQNDGILYIVSLKRQCLPLFHNLSTKLVTGNLCKLWINVEHVLSCKGCMCYCA
jgi:hypothetical protein